MNRSARLNAHFSLAAVLVAALATGCATRTPDVVQSPGRSIVEITGQYEQGNEMVDRGLRMQAEAEEQIASATARRAEGASLVTRGKTLMTESERAFRDRASQDDIR